MIDLTVKEVKVFIFLTNYDYFIKLCYLSLRRDYRRLVFHFEEEVVLYNWGNAIFAINLMRAGSSCINEQHKLELN